MRNRETGETNEELEMNSPSHSPETPNFESRIPQWAAPPSESHKVVELEAGQPAFLDIVLKSAEGILVVDCNGVMRFANPVAKELFRFRAERLLGQMFGFPIIAEGVTELEVLHGGCEIKTVEMRVEETEWEGKAACLVQLHDITDRKRAEELSMSREKLMAMTTLASVVGHEIRGPLGVIKNSAEFLKLRLGKSVDEKILRHLLILQDEVDASDEIIDDILGFARTERLGATTADLNAMLNAQIERANVPDNVRIVREFDANLPLVNVDASQVQRVFLNIISNAVAAMPKGGTLTIITEGQGPARISFRDTGQGIAANILDRVFEPLFTTKSKGTGLGLATCRNILHAHDGEIRIESQTGRGTLVTVELPIGQQLMKGRKR